uniref:NADH dehydrogenase subunit 4L n=1 Tax=Osmia excavata TaxID=124290 RepID=A0A2R2Z385_9HYME|nr:NADH dehydrogenase subunit 4L [Osmia excavata]
MLKSYFLILMILIFMMMMMINKYFLMFLISMEFFVVLNLLILMLDELEYLSWMFMYYLIFSVCEAVLGLSIVVSMLSVIGNQGFMMMNLKC